VNAEATLHVDGQVLDRIRRMEQDLINARIANAELSSSVEHLTKAVDMLTITVATLRDTINQGRGAVWVIAAAAGTVGAFAGMLVKRVFGLG